MSAIPIRSKDDRFYRYLGVNFTFGLLDCDHYIGNIVIPWIVKPGFCSIHFTVTLAGLKMLYREYRFIEDRYIGVPLNVVVLGI